MSALPKAVQQQLDEAERMMQQQATPPADPPADPPPAADVPPQDPPAPPPQEPQPAPQPAEPPQDAEYWRRRFETIEGKYKAEVPRMSQALTETQQQLMQLRAQLEASVQRQPAPAATPPAPLVTEKDDEKFGSDLIDMVRRVAREERRSLEQALGQIDQMIRQVAPQLQRVQEVEKKVESTREGQFLGELSREVPDWETVNVDQRFLDWLKEYDPVAGKTRQLSLNEAGAAFDARRVVAIFKMFKATLPPATPPQRDQARSELARQVAPSRSATTTVTPPGERTYTAAEYQRWLDPRRVHDTPRDKLEQMLAEMERALAEGRVKF